MATGILKIHLCLTYYKSVIAKKPSCQYVRFRQHNRILAISFNELYFYSVHDFLDPFRSRSSVNRG